ncbi:tryptophan dimethylallyltransferase family protein [Streptomyces phaeofaciens]|uniref:tryptophan dimethylallyltransferase family protein n=1 Tax=Streptomyces phaeofaciens TaxID=68254 RepID=UPI00368C5493
MTATARTPEDGHPPTGPDGYAGQALRGLTYLGRLFDLGPRLPGAAREAVQALFAGWGHRTSREIDEPRAARGQAPFEFSLVLHEPDPEVRIFLRPLAPEGPTTAADSWEQGWRALRALEEQGAATLTRADGLRDLFRPRSDRAAFGLCIAATVRPTGITGVKAYFDTMAAGVDDNRRIVGEAMQRLGHGTAWHWLRDNDPAGITHLIPAFLALDLADSPQARIKFYTTVEERSGAALGSRLDRLSPTARRTAAALLDTLPADGPAALTAPGTRPTLCWNLTDDGRERPDDATLYLPFHRYTPAGDEALDRLRTYVPPAHLHRLAGFLTHSTPDDAPGPAPNPFHWAATKLHRPAPAPLTLYAPAAVVDRASRAVG